MFRESVDDGPILIRLLALFVNRTEINVQDQLIKIETKPIDILPMTYYPIHFVKHLYVKKLPNEFLDVNPFRASGLYAQLKTGKEALLLWDLDKQTLMFIAQEINSVLNASNK